MSQGEREAVLGIDGGGTKTIAQLADVQGRLLARADGGPMNVQRMAIAELRAVLQPMLTTLFAAPDLPPIELRALCAGFAGAGSIPSDRPLHTLLAAVLHQAGSGRAVKIAPDLRSRIEHDMLIALAAGAGDRPGIVVIGGTGSSVFGLNGALSARVGGWGPFFGDEGSGYAIGIEALRSVMQAHDGRLPPTALAAQLCRAWECQSPPELLHAWRTRRPSVAEVAGLSVLVAAVADADDSVARTILLTAGQALGHAAATAVAQLDLAAARFPLVLSGGILRHIALVRNECIARVLAAAPHAEPALLTAEPVTGAVRLAIQQLNAGS